MNVGYFDILNRSGVERECDVRTDGWTDLGRTNKMAFSNSAL